MNRTQGEWAALTPLSPTLTAALQDIAELHKCVRELESQLETKPLPNYPEFQYRFAGSLIWHDMHQMCPHLSETFDGVYRLKPGKYPTDHICEKCMAQHLVEIDPEQAECLNYHKTPVITELLGKWTIVSPTGEHWSSPNLVAALKNCGKASIDITDAANIMNAAMMVEGLVSYVEQVEYRDSILEIAADAIKHFPGDADRNKCVQLVMELKSSP